MRILIALSISFLLCMSSTCKQPSYDVIVFLHDECIISRYYTKPLNEMVRDFVGEANFLAVFPNPQMDERRLKKFKEEYNILFDMTTDEDYSLTNKFHATITPEVFVVNRKSNKVVYSGRIDNAYARVGKKRPIVTHHELYDALNQIKNNQDISIESQPAIGCHITQIKSP